MITIYDGSSIEKIIENINEGKMVMKIPDEIYHDPLCPGISRSQLNKFAISPADYITYLSEPKETTEAMEFGEYYHEAIIFPDEFDKKATALPEIKGVRGNTKSQQIEAIKKDNPGKIYMDADWLDTIKKMRSFLFADKDIRKIFESDVKEIAFFFKYEELLLKCKVDSLLTQKQDSFVIFDLKSTQKGGALSENFKRNLYDRNQRLYAQVALYSMCVTSALGLGYRPDFRFIVQEKKAPFNFAQFILSEKYVDFAVEMVLNDIENLAICKKANRFPGYKKDVQEIDLPRWLEGLSYE